MLCSVSVLSHTFQQSVRFQPPYESIEQQKPSAADVKIPQLAPYKLHLFATLIAMTLFLFSPILVDYRIHITLHNSTN